jgi:hypothetical protein
MILTRASPPMQMDQHKSRPAAANGQIEGDNSILRYIPEWRATADENWHLFIDIKKAA